MKKCLTLDLENLKLMKVSKIKITTSKFNELRQDLITEVKPLIQLEVEKVVKKQNEESDVTLLKLNNTGA